MKNNHTHPPFVSDIDPEVVVKYQFPAKLIALAQKLGYGHCTQSAHSAVTRAGWLVFDSGLTIKIRPRWVEINGVAVESKWLQGADGRLVHVDGKPVYKDGIEDYLRQGVPGVCRINEFSALQAGETC